MEKPKRISKYGVSKKEDRTFEGKVYASKLEMNYRKYLDSQKSKGEVQNYEEQVPFTIFINNKKICTYRLDFEVVYKDGSVKYIDTKGVKTSIYRLKKKMVEAYFDIEITEVEAKTFKP